jgi:hypothetical protein
VERKKPKPPEPVKERSADLFWMPEHHDSEKFNVFRRPEHVDIDIAWPLVGLVGGGEDDKAKFPNGRPFYVLASREESE